jgi:hypothetical protein
MPTLAAMSRSRTPGSWAMHSRTRSNVPAPVTPRSGFPRARLPSSETHAAAASGAVSAGSNPAGGTGQRHKFEHPNNLDASQPWVCDLRLRNGAVMFAPRALPQWPPLLLLRRSWHIAISAYEAVALLSQVGTPSPTLREHNGLASTAYMRQIAEYSLGHRSPRSRPGARRSPRAVSSYRLCPD